MYVIREVLHCKPGKVRTMVEKFRSISTVLTDLGHEPLRLLTDVSGEPFRVFVRNPATIDQLIQLQQGFAFASIPNGRLRRGPGAGNHNAPFSWHLDSEDIQLAGFTMELCDGRPSYVEDHVSEYADVIGRYCPWGARLVRVDDYRD